MQITHLNLDCFTLNVISKFQFCVHVLFYGYISAKMGFIVLPREYRHGLKLQSFLCCWLLWHPVVFSSSFLLKLCWKAFYK